MGAHRADPFLSAVGVLEEEPRRVELDGEPPGLERRLHRAPGARSLCGPPIESGDQTLEKSRLIFLARETRAFSGLRRCGPLTLARVCGGTHARAPESHASFSSRGGHSLRTRKTRCPRTASRSHRRCYGRSAKIGSSSPSTCPIPNTRGSTWWTTAT